MDTVSDPRRRLARAGLAGLGLAILGGCASSRRSQSARSSPAPAARPASRDVAGSPEAVEVVVRAMGLIGVPYQWGGNDPREGFDCSGLVTHVYLEAVGMKLPRTSRLISGRGEKVARSRLAPGDLVFFNTTRQPFSHVGIYVSDDRFVHAPSSGSLVRVDSMGLRYWQQRFAGARRLLPA